MTSPLTGTLLAEIISISADAIICVDHEQRITFFNEGAERIFGYGTAEVMGKPLEMLLPARHRTSHHRHIERFSHSQVRARRMGERQEISGLRKSGEEFPAEAAISRVQHGQEVMYSVVLRDITARRQAEVRQRFLLEAGELLSASIDLDETLRLIARLWIPSLADAVVVEVLHDDSLRFLHAERTPDGAIVSSDVAAIAGVRWMPVVGLDDTQPLPASVIPVDLALAAVPAAVRGPVGRADPHVAIVIPLVHLGDLLGRVTLLRADSAAIAVDDLVLMEDLGRRAAVALENARLHDEVQRAVAARNDTMSVVSHDLRNPVNAVKMLAAAALQSAGQGAVPDAIREQIGVIQSAAQQMDTLIQDLLDMSRVEAGRFAVDPRPVQLAPLFADVLRTLAPLAEAKQIHLDLQWEETLPDLFVDAERTAQVLSNVVGNAIKFTPTSGRVSIAAVPRESDVLVSVVDTGPGIPPEDLPHVFDRYWQSSRRFGGAGLGLPIAKAIVEAHGGTIWAENASGGGALICFTLPTRRAAAGQPA
ncbi:MAG TPA: PAS domain-containing sensor histidine kinase [Gemmatimonadaceae bacterium]|nr:PAS domain-containing sensor histidine kinase [Gemmatimonadaceae bacterium]